MPIAHSASFRRSGAAAEASSRKPLSLRYGILLRADIKRSFFREFIWGHTAAIFGRRLAFYDLVCSALDHTRPRAPQVEFH